MLGAVTNATWAGAAKQSNDFNGTGNDLTLVGDAPRSLTHVRHRRVRSAKTCPPTSCYCTGTAHVGQSTLTITVAPAGRRATCCGCRSARSGRPLDCRNGDNYELTHGHGDFDVTGTGAKLATLRIDKTT